MSLKKNNKSSVIQFLYGVPLRIRPWSSTLNHIHHSSQYHHSYQMQQQSHHIYGDDTQLLLSLSALDFSHKSLTLKTLYSWCIQLDVINTNNNNIYCSCRMIFIDHVWHNELLIKNIPPSCVHRPSLPACKMLTRTFYMVFRHSKRF